MTKLRVMGVGAGYFSQFQYLGWRNIEDADCVAIVNPTRRRRRAGRRYGMGSLWRPRPR
jgi:hypothetical protein